MSRAARVRPGSVMTWLALVAGAVVMAFPIYWMLVTAIRPRTEIFDREVNLLPSALLPENFVTAWTRLPFADWTLNSTIITVASVILTVTINLLCGYAFAKFRFVGRDVLFIAIVSALMIPVQVVLVPLFLIIADFGLLNTHWGIIIPRAAEAFGIFMVRQFMVSLPDELLEAARIDGAGELRIFFRIVLPLSLPIVAVLTIFTFMWRWNEFALPLVVLTDQTMFTLQLGLNLLRGQFNTEWTSIMAMAFVSLIPLLLIFAFCQRFLVQGVATTGLK